MALLVRRAAACGAAVTERVLHGAVLKRLAGGIAGAAQHVGRNRRAGKEKRIDQLDEILPEYHASERHALLIQAPPARVYALLRSADLGQSRIIRTLFWLRGLPALFKRQLAPPSAQLTLEDFLAHGFILLGEQPERELVLGLAGRFWRPTGDILRLSAAEFRSFNAPGYARAAMTFWLEVETPTQTRLVTETRVLCHDAASRRSFKRYWLLMRPFSGLIRREMLRAIRRAAEDQAARTA